MAKSAAYSAALLVAAMLSGPGRAQPPASEATPEWKDATQRDELTGKPINMVSIVGKPALRQFGRSVSVRLVLKCTDLYHGNKQFEDENFYSAILWFSEPVGVADTQLRYTFDGGDPKDWTASIEVRGHAIYLSTIRKQDAFIEPLSRASTLKVQLDLPWAGNPVVTFNVAGAADALRRVPCHDARFQ